MAYSHFFSFVIYLHECVWRLLRLAALGGIPNARLHLAKRRFMAPARAYALRDNGPRSFDDSILATPVRIRQHFVGAQSLDEAHTPAAHGSAQALCAISSCLLPDTKLLHSHHSNLRDADSSA
jgi:hypothetical protein